jgi:AAA+ superfamily predicted ATPase
MIQPGCEKVNPAVLDVLLSALYQNGRIFNRRYSTLEFSNQTGFSLEYCRAIYKASFDGAMVITYEQEDTLDGDFAPSGSDTVEDICKLIREYHNEVLTILCLPRAGEKTKQAFLENLNDVTLLPLSAETVFGDKALNYLTQCATNMQVTPDDKLYEGFGDPKKGYGAADLNRIFDKWFDNKLKTEIYAQYADFEAANRQVAGKKARGSAYSELTEMIGLTDAKAVINQALDFYKAQKLFKEKGVKSERPAMHMVFTGNPGTAKTTVARLFAQIMKENDLLSEGDLIEVGRADLVGKYVGSTAPTVRKAFRKARGSVLFIDEAYSLVDDRDGSFGDEAINTIVQEMENNREDMVVIFAGYPDKMEGFLQKNPGLRSRIAFHVPFADYSADELIDITALLAKKQGISLAPDVADKLKPIYEGALRSDDFGNGRYARNLLEKARLKQASRLVAMDIDSVTGETIAMLVPDDFEAPPQSKMQKNTIGFCR